MFLTLLRIEWTWAYLIATWTWSKIFIREIEFFDAQGAATAASVYTTVVKLNLTELLY